MLDEKTDTSWASSTRGIITLTLDLVRSYQIQSLRVTFASTFPSRMESTFVFDSRDTETRAFTCSGSECVIDLSQMDSPQTMDKYEKLRAETIKISMHRAGLNNVQSFVVSEIFVLGRCDCEGSATSCLYDGVGGYECNCSAKTNTRGVACDTCNLNFIKSSDQFGCPLACSCDQTGVANVNDMCDQVNGLCKCKSNVDGAACDRCKPFTYSLQSTNPDGCSACNCNKTGALSCSNTTGECQCRDNTVSDQCDQCSDNSYSFADGCKLCDCNTDGTVGKRTDCTDIGQCYCKENVMGLKCDMCKPGFYSLSATSIPGCKACSCHSVGAEHQTCNSVTGQCHCRNGDISDLACNPVISSMDPTFGPETGGTRVTINGHLLGNDSQTIKVMLGNTFQQILDRKEDVIIFSSQSYNSSGTPGGDSHSLHVEWAGNGNAIQYPFTFHYLDDPVFDKSRSDIVITYSRTLLFLLLALFSYLKSLSDSHMRKRKWCI
ncbi:usherin [Elysia marginata]|uniref:Usherin n=1 Tax=Elysia marginata TaxID=1093978 RepID=A0AAV4F803_9GAST|nr:usherin [Elysia marginata]